MAILEAIFCGDFLGNFLGGFLDSFALHLDTFQSALQFASFGSNYVPVIVLSSYFNNFTGYLDIVTKYLKCLGKSK